MIIKTGLLIELLLLATTVNGIEPAKVDFKINTRLVKSDGREWCYIKKSDHPGAKLGHNGLLVIWSTYHSDYRAFDRKCPICDRKGSNSSIRMYNRFEAMCDKCRTRYEVVNSAGFPANSSLTDCPLIGYNCYEKGEILHIFSNDLYRDKNLNSYSSNCQLKPKANN